MLSKTPIPPGDALRPPVKRASKYTARSSGKLICVAAGSRKYRTAAAQLSSVTDQNNCRRARGVEGTKALNLAGSDVVPDAADKHRKINDGTKRKYKSL